MEKLTPGLQAGIFTDQRGAHKPHGGPRSDKGTAEKYAGAAAILTGAARALALFQTVLTSPAIIHKPMENRINSRCCGHWEKTGHSSCYQAMRGMSALDMPPTVRPTFASLRRRANRSRQ